DLLYLDPPFATGNDFGDYRDDWKISDAYLQMLYERFWAFRELLADAGVFFTHLDWRATPYAKLMLDELFGPDHFRNEIIWSYRRWPARSRRFQRQHDNLLFYVKDCERYNWNQLYEPLSPGTLRTHGLARQQAVFAGKRRVNSIDTSENSLGAPLGDVWQLSVLNARAKERTGYATQKPEALLERIILATTNPGDLIADLCCGSGTTLAVAERLGRRWIGCDRSSRAISVSRTRLTQLGAHFSLWHDAEIADT
ncbi:MAG: site-specific DNA-methyltransferase, partial [Cyanobacteria bacterium NC_groundwater_1444_Ag_S-0.65um_54_12]|nr:site-specific DNA-methyltransferase [Cyanobacteria bacterium NC_groundwater_1444_Ag_S-0.65um_54_12]